MRLSSLVKLTSVFFALALFVGCAKAPQELVDSAKAALDAAKQVEADRYVADQFAAAKDSLDAALAEIETQNSKFALTRNYGRAQGLLQAAITAANAAKDAAAANKEAVRVEAESLMTQMSENLASAKKLLARAPKGKEGRAALEMIQSDLNALDAAAAEATTAMTNSDFLTARDKAKAGLDKVNAIIEELNAAIAKKAGGMR